MKTHAQVVVIGGGVVGCSVLYHLSKAGWKDVVLVERKQLTAGSTWHAAGGIHTLNGDPNVAALQKYTVELYQKIEETSGHECGIHLPGELMLADTEERLDWLRMAHARGRYLGMETEIITPAEAKKIMPFMDESHFVGAMYDRHGGQVDPSGVTHAYAKAAQMAGAEVYLDTWAREITRHTDGSWDVVCDRGTINCEHVVNAGGLWAREVGRMIGLELPILAMEHMYLLTDEIPEVQRCMEESDIGIPMVIDFGAEIYSREEQGGLLLGTYEKACVPWSPLETPWDFGSQLLDPDIDRISPSLEVAFTHFPIFNDARIRQVVNGPFTFAPDGNPLVGPVRGQPGQWVACGVMAGLAQGGGVGLALANWMIESDPGFDIWGMDVARFGDWATPVYTSTKVQENYSRRFQIAFPNEELPAARPLQTSPIYGRLGQANAVWGVAFGLEYALWFQREGEPPVEEVTFKRSNAFERVAAEVATVRESVGLMETTGFAKFEFTGSGARGWLSNLLANGIPYGGQMALAPMLNHDGKLIGDFTVATLGVERFMLVGSGVAERYYERYLDAHLPADGSVQLRTLGPELAGLSIAGPKSRKTLQALTRADLAADAFPFLHIREMNVGMIPALIGRISYTGDLGYEFWVPASYQAALFDLLREAGEEHGMGLFGLRALDSLRLEKSFGAWASEYRPVYDPYEAGLGRFVRLDKDGFVGREAAERIRAKGPARRLMTFVVEPEDADVLGDEPIWHRGEVIGWVTSGGYAHWSRASVALGYVPIERADADDGFEIEVLGVRRAAHPQREALFDPTGARMRD